MLEIFLDVINANAENLVNGLRVTTKIVDDKIELVFYRVKGEETPVYSFKISDKAKRRQVLNAYTIVTREHVISDFKHISGAEFSEHVYKFSYTFEHQNEHVRQTTELKHYYMNLLKYLVSTFFAVPPVLVFSFFQNTSGLFTIPNLSFSKEESGLLLKAVYQTIEFEIKTKQKNKKDTKISVNYKNQKEKCSTSRPGHYAVYPR